MWVAVIRCNGEKALLGGLCKRNNVSAIGYPIHIRRERRSLGIYFTGVLFGDEKNKINFISFLRKSKRIRNLEVNGDFITGQLVDSKLVEATYKHSIFHKEPIRIGSNGFELWNVASFNRKDLIRFIDSVEKDFDAEILKIQEIKVSNLSVLTIYPELTDIQKKAMELAINNGYYNSPRKIDVKALAKMMGLSYATYHVHLRKAEKKIIPFLFNKGTI